MLLQADASAWMGFFCSIMLEISLMLAQREPIYQDMASKFFEHFIAIIDAMNNVDEIGKTKTYQRKGSCIVKKSILEPIRVIKVVTS